MPDCADNVISQSISLTDDGLALIRLYEERGSEELVRKWDGECVLSYKGMAEVLRNITPTAAVTGILRPVYNFKAAE